MEIVSICAAAIVSAVAAAAIRKYAPEISVGLVLMAGALLTGTLLLTLSPLLSVWKDLSASAGAAGEFQPLLLKTAGICLLCQFASDTCKDAGQPTLAGKVELSGRVAIMLSALPLFLRLFSTVTEMMKG